MSPGSARPATWRGTATDPADSAPGFGDRPRDQCAADPRHRFLTGPVDVEHDHLVGEVERGTELVAKSAVREYRCGWNTTITRPAVRPIGPASASRRPRPARPGPRWDGARSRRTPARRARRPRELEPAVYPAETRETLDRPRRPAHRRRVPASSAARALSAMCLPGTASRTVRGASSPVSWNCGDTADVRGFQASSRTPTATPRVSGDPSPCIGTAVAEDAQVAGRPDAHDTPASAAEPGSSRQTTRSPARAMRSTKSSNTRT